MPEAPPQRETAAAKLDRSHDVLRSEGHPLDAIFQPKSVAVIGATERADSVGRAVLWSLVSSPFGGTVYPVSEKRTNVLGIRAYPRIGEVPERVELAVIVTPAATVPDVITQCVAAGIRAAVIISAGFKEHGEKGEQLEREILARIRGTSLRVIGPNCLGVMNPVTGMNATFATKIARAGNVAFISQSGALCTTILDWSEREMLGFSAFVSVGSMLDVGWGDLIDYFGNDARTQSIVMYMESVGDARAFLSAAREVTLMKPVIVMKAGRTDAAAQAAASHTGALTGSDEVLEAAFRRCGVLRVNSIAELFYMADVLSKQPRPKGPHFTIFTNAGGPGVLAADALLENGGQLAQLAPETLEALNKALPPHWSRSNPVDVLGDSTPERYAQTLEITLRDPNTDGLLAINCPQGMAEATRTAEAIRNLASGSGKPVLASWMGGPEMTPGIEILNRAGIPTFEFPDTAARVFQYMWNYSYHLRGLYETPVLRTGTQAPDRATVESILTAAHDAGRTLLSEFESKQVLDCYGIPTVKTALAANEEEAVACAARLGYPVALKLHSHTITHKTDVGGVELRLKTAEEVRQAFRDVESSVREKAGASHFLGVTLQPMISTEGYELILGSSVDVQFGPVLLFGTGGQLVEVFQDHALGLPPLTSTLARRMMERTRIYEALTGVRGRKPVNLPALEELLVRFSELVVEQPWIREIDVNPLLASSEQLLALDARVVLHPADAGEHLPRTAIRPFPAQYARPWTMKNGVEVMIRPIRPEDESLLISFHKALSERTVYLRYFQPLKLSQRVSHERLVRICFQDYDRQIALVVESKDATGAPIIIAVGRLSKIHGHAEAELAVLVDDRFQHLGLGKELYRRMIEIARAEKLQRVLSTILTENLEMRAICTKLSFALRADLEEDTIQAVLELT